jgi:hypothetical protein
MFPDSVFAHPTGSFNSPVPPPDVDPDVEPTTTIRVNCLWLKYIRGALTQLLLQSTWQGDSDAVQLAIQRSTQLISMMADEDCEMCDCLEFTNGQWHKGIPNGSGGTTFVPVDPRTEGTVDPPWPPEKVPEGQTGNCLAAANLTAHFRASMQQLLDSLEAGALFSSALVGLEALLALALPIIGEVIVIATEMAASAIDLGATEFAVDFFPVDADDLYHILQCVLECNITTDGVVTADAIEVSKALFAPLIDAATDSVKGALWQFFVNDWLDSQGPNGLTKLGNLANIISADCSDCTACSWCHHFDFRISDYGWLPDSNEGRQGQWVEGVGWIPDADAEDVYFRYPEMPDDVTIILAKTWVLDNGLNPFSASELLWREGGVNIVRQEPLASGVNIKQGNVGSYIGKNLTMAIVGSLDGSAVGQQITIRGTGTDPWEDLAPIC